MERVRAELPQAFRAPQAVRDAGAMPASGQAAGSVTARPEAALAVLRAALAQERQITTDLRNELDTVRIALAIEQELAATLRGERDLWAGRAQVLASAMSREASAVAEDAPAAAGRAEVAVRAIA